MLGCVLAESKLLLMLRLDRLADWFARGRTVTAVAVVAMTVWAIFGIGRLQFDDVPQAIFKSDDDDYRTLEELTKQFGEDDHVCLLVLRGDDLFTPQGVRVVRAIVRGAAQVEGVESVRSLQSVRVFADKNSIIPRPLLPADPDDLAALGRSRTLALDHPLVAGQLLSPDGRATLILIRIDADRQSIRGMTPVVKAIHRVADKATDGTPFEALLTGIPPLRVDIYDAVQRDTIKFSILGAALSFLIATLLFRRLSATLIVTVAAGMGAVWTLGAMGWVGEKLNVINVVLPTLIIVVGLTDAVHLMVDIRRSLARGETRLEAAKDAIRHLGLACMMTSLTTAVGFGSLIVADAEIIRNFGLACAAGALFTMTSVLTIVPLLCSTPLGRFVASPVKSHRWSRPRGMALGLIDWIIVRARPITIAGVGLTVALTTIAMRLQPDALLTETIPNENETFRALRYCDEVFGGSLTTFALVEWDPSLTLGSPEVTATLAEVQQIFAEHPDTQHPLSVINVLQSFPGDRDDWANKTEFVRHIPAELRDRLVRTELRRAVVIARIKDVGSARHQTTSDALEASLAKVEVRHPGVTATLTGTIKIASQSIDRMIDDLAKSLLLAAAVIFVTLTLVFGSLRIGLISVLPNVFPLVTTATVMVITGHPLQLSTVIVFTICLGIAVDDTIHLLNRFQRERESGADAAEAIRRSFMSVGRALVMTTLILLAGFGSVMFSEMPSSRIFAWLSCVAIASALIGDLIFLPAMLAWLMRRPSRREKARAKAAMVS